MCTPIKKIRHLKYMLISGFFLLPSLASADAVSEGRARILDGTYLYFTSAQYCSHEMSDDDIAFWILSINIEFGITVAQMNEHFEENASRLNELVRHGYSGNDGEQQCQWALEQRNEYRQILSTIREN